MNSVKQELLKINRIPEVLVEDVFATGRTIVVRLKEPEKARCPKCGSVSQSVKNRYQRRLYGIGVYEHLFEVQMTTVHFRCRESSCEQKTFAPDLGIAEGKSPFLPALKEYVRTQHFETKHNNGEVRKDVRDRYQVKLSECTLRRIEESTPEEPIKLKPKVLGLDELYRKGKREVELTLHDLDKGILLGVVEGIRQVDLEKLLDNLGQIELSEVKYVVKDLYPHWDLTLKERLGPVTIVADPFHVIKRVTKLLYEEHFAGLRMELHEQELKAEAAEVFKARWVFKKGVERLSASQSTRLSKTLNQYPQLEQAWILKERIREVYQSQTRSQAREKLVWCLGYAQERGFDGVYRTLKRNRLSILNRWHKCDGPKVTLNHYPEERISQLRRVEQKRGHFKKLETFVRNMQIGYQRQGVI